MRCPKCGYISFDHLATCLNCNKDISGISSTAQGTTYNAAAPTFLKFSQSSGPRESSFASNAVPEELAGDLDLVDPDLNILINEDEEEGIAFHPDEPPFDISLEKEGRDAESRDNELSVDLGSFKDAALEEGFGGRKEEKFTMNLPDELADISDLKPPAPSQKQKQRSAVAGSKASDEGFDMLDMDMDLKLDGLDMGFSLTDQDKGGKEVGIGGLSLDDIDLSVSSDNVKPAPAKPKPVPAAKPGEMDMDSDLDFDLDLGGLTSSKK